MPTEELKDDANRYLMQTYTRQPLSIVRGRGTKVYDLEGREYTDFVGLPEYRQLENRYLPKATIENKYKGTT